MTVLHTTNYGIAYCDDLHPVRGIAAVMQEVATTVDAALGRGGIAPPDATTQAQLSARVATLESWRTTVDAALAVLSTYVTARSTAAQNIGSSAPTTITALSFGAATANPSSMWASGNPSRLVAPATGEYDLSTVLLWGANGSGTRGVAYRITTPLQSPGAWVPFATRPPTVATYGSETTEVYPGITLTSGQYLEVGAWQDSGAIVALGSGSRATLRRVA